MSASKKSANSGIDALLGFEFQRNCALYLLLSDYSRFKGRDFFLCIEHHDDFMFCYRTTQATQIEEISSYQAKKQSGAVWSIDKRFTEMLSKVLEVGSDLVHDSVPKSKSYNHQLTFISNTDIKLSYTPAKAEKTNGKKVVTHLLNEQNCKSSFRDFPDDIKEKVDQKLVTYCDKEKITYHKHELDNLYIQWIDFPRNKSAQKDSLVGLMVRHFSHVVDPSAAVELLLSLFRDVEAVYNQKKIISLLDSTKRIEGCDIQKAVDVIETEQKAFDFWRSHSSVLSNTFKIPVGIQAHHVDYIKNTFELLKDMSNHEHQIIKSFVRDNDYSMNYHNHESMFEAYIVDINSRNSMNLKDVDIFFFHAMCICRVLQLGIFNENNYFV